MSRWWVKFCLSNIHITLSLSFIVILSMLTVYSSAIAAESNGTVSGSVSERSTLRSTLLSSKAISSRENIGGPATAGAQIRGDVRIMKAEQFRLPYFDNFLLPWFAWKKKLMQQYGLDLGIDDNLLFQQSTTSLTGINKAAGNIFRIFGKWTLVDRRGTNRGSLIFKFENRSRLGTDIAPEDSANEIGYQGIIGTSFSDVGTIVNELYWEQFFYSGQLGLVVGRLSGGNFVDTSGYTNPFTTFKNFAILIDPSVAIPSSGIGMLVNAWIYNEWSILAGVYDANGQKDEVTFFGQGLEVFSHIEIGWSPLQQQRFLKNLHIILWHSNGKDPFNNGDQLDNNGQSATSTSEGIGFTGNWFFNQCLMPFLRVGWSKGTAPAMNESLTTGLLYLLADKVDLIGIGFNVGKPSIPPFRTQYTSEIFYRFQLAKSIAITPSIQYLIHPAQNSQVNSIWVFGIRGRIAL